jgi:hypothetical protein
MARRTLGCGAPDDPRDPQRPRKVGGILRRPDQGDSGSSGFAGAGPGIITVSIAWITPLLERMLQRVMFALPTVGPSSVAPIWTEEPSGVRTLPWGRSVVRSRPRSRWCS